MIKLDDYKKEKLTIDIVKANIYGILIMIPVFLIYGIPFYLLHFNDSTLLNFKELIKAADTNSMFLFPLYFFLIFLIGIILHELIHGITWSIFAKKGFKSIKFGVLWKMLTPYCHCKEPLLVKHYILGAIMPAIFLGIIPALYSLIFGNIAVLIFGALFTVAAVGDFLVINLIRKEDRNSLVQDHPSEAGCFIYRKV
ncbi:DUF3267 domain-containing protein [Lutibacter citreus]|uniref:DUF3267 domain-containing protein n=1 Tax=Lutibacter citreus TaxID=2138210 RepID=UPI000DBE4D90|nr:DUF3267 domain-containing protein [Lutibacter citreus]